jgi:hypothetical protein
MKGFTIASGIMRIHFTSTWVKVLDSERDRHPGLKDELNEKFPRSFQGH